MVFPFRLQAPAQCNYSYNGLLNATVLGRPFFSFREGNTFAKIDYNGMKKLVFTFL